SRRPAYAWAQLIIGNKPRGHAMTQAPGLEASARVVRSVTAVTDSLSARYGRGRREVLARTFQTALVLLPPPWAAIRHPRERGQFQRTNMAAEIPLPVWQRSPGATDSIVQWSAWGQVLRSCTRRGASASHQQADRADRAAAAGKGPSGEPGTADGVRGSI